ncbi:MobC family plasmid mobilization relaxosome protein [Streptomyces sp. NPDC006640]|uniref:MobC family plasmid mobilization relaxosome protein n=1 Tax=unclassified Streptomyces TaxID=2593676 RepID=UPI00367CDD8B
MSEQPAAKKPQKNRPRRRAREDGGHRAKRFLVSYNEDEMAVLMEAAARDNAALAAWVAGAAFAVARGSVVPVSSDAKEVLQEFIHSRGQLRRIGNNLNQIAYALNADGVVTNPQLKAVLASVEEAVRRVDEATLQVMRERRPRS